jgi:hypothetical protein
MRLMAQTRTVILRITAFALGILGLALFMWTPRTNIGIFVYLVLFVALIGVAIAVSKSKDEG